MAKKQFFALLCGLIFLSGSAFAQNTEQFRHKLSLSDPYSSARVTIQEQGDAGTVIRNLESTRKLTKIGGYRVRIFFDNSQAARPNANTTRNKFNEMFPDIPSYISYENPYWKVTVGNCISNEEAIILWGRVKSTFDRAFVIREEIELSEVAKEVARPIEPEPLP